MSIEDLTYLEKICDEGNIVGGNTSVGINVFGEARGKYALTYAKSQSLGVSLPDGGSVAAGSGVAFAFAYTPPSGPN